MLAYIPYMDPMGNIYIYIQFNYVKLSWHGDMGAYVYRERERDK